MALTIRLTDDEAATLILLQDRLGYSTMSGMFKDILLKQVPRMEREIIDLREEKDKCRQRFMKAERVLYELGKANEATERFKEHYNEWIKERE